MKILIKFIAPFVFGAVVYAGMKTAHYFMGPLQSQIIVCLVWPDATVEECRPFQDLVSKGGV